MSEPVDPHWRARLSDIQDLLLVATDADTVARAVLQLTAVLQDEWGARSDPAVQLLRDAYDLLTNPETHIDLRTWTRAAEPFVHSGTNNPAGRAEFADFISDAIMQRLIVKGWRPPV